jgi:hypothetical protein
MEFSLAEYVPRGFGDVVAVLGDRPITTLARATASATAHHPLDASVLGGGEGELLAVEHGCMTLGPARVARLPVAWRTTAGVLVIECELRVLPVDGGADPVSELLLSGAFRTEAARRLRPLGWLRHVVEEVTLDLVPRAERPLLLA